jgi:hypothetical protein
MKSPSDNVGKEIRVRTVLGFAARSPRDVKGDLVDDLLARMRVAGCFDPMSDQYGTDTVVRAAQRAFHLLGWRLGSDGTLAPIVLKSADGPIRRPALESMIRRIQSSGEDGPLLVTEAKSLLEATAMYVLEETGFSCPATPDFNQVLYPAGIDGRQLACYTTSALLLPILLSMASFVYIDETGTSRKQDSSPLPQSWSMSRWCSPWPMG